MTTWLGVLLKEFLDRWGQRGMARGAVMVVLSDGWERGDAARLRRLAHRIVWSNPRKGHPGYAPLAAGMAAAFPHIDDFEGHSLAPWSTSPACSPAPDKRPTQPSSEQKPPPHA